MTKVVESGWAKMQVETCAADKQARSTRARDVIVGVEQASWPRKIRSTSSTSTTTRCAIRRSPVSKQIRATRWRCCAGRPRRADRAPKPVTVTCPI